MFNLRRLDIPVKSGGRKVEGEYAEYHRARGVKLKRKYTQGYVKLVRK